jgi:hypothetical protein
VIFFDFEEGVLDGDASCALRFGGVVGIGSARRASVPSLKTSFRDDLVSRRPTRQAFALGSRRSRITRVSVVQRYR